MKNHLNAIFDDGSSAPKSVTYIICHYRRNSISIMILFSRVRSWEQTEPDESLEVI